MQSSRWPALTLRHSERSVDLSLSENLAFTIFGREAKSTNPSSNHEANVSSSAFNTPNLARKSFL